MYLFIMVSTCHKSFPGDRDILEISVNVRKHLVKTMESQDNTLQVQDELRPGEKGQYKNG